MAQLNSTVERGAYGISTDFLSTYDSIARLPQALDKVYQKYGKGLLMFNFLQLAGTVKGVTSPNLKIIEEGAPERLVTVSLPTAIAGATTTITVATSDGSDKYIREGFDLLIPPAYTNASIEKAMRVFNDAGTWKGIFYDDTVAITGAITTKELMLGASSWGYGTGQPDAMFRGFYERTTNERILKESMGLEGAQLYQEDYKAVEDANGNKGLWSKGIMEMDFRLDSQVDNFLLTGEVNGNSSLTSTSYITGQSSAIPSANGLISTMNDLALEQTWSTGYDITYFEALKGLLESVGVAERTVDFFVGTGLATSILKNMQSYLNTNAPGTELYDRMGNIGFKVNSVDYNGVLANVMELGSLANPNKFGGSEYGYRNMGFIFPKGENAVTLNNEKLSLPHLTLGYPVGKGENRTRVISKVPGVGNQNPIAANQYDGDMFYMFTHVIPIWTYMEQTIFVHK